MILKKQITMVSSGDSDGINAVEEEVIGIGVWGDGDS